MINNYELIQKGFINLNTNNHILNRIFRAALVAMIIADLAEIIAAMIDGMLTGRFLGAESIAAFGIAKPFFSITGVLSAVLSSGALITASHVIGKGDKDSTNQIFSLTCLGGIILSTGFALTGIIFINQFASILGANGELFPIVRKYLLGLLLGVPAIVMGNILTVFMQLEGKYNNVNLSVLATIIVNLGGDTFNIFYLNGDMFGMGLATSASYYAALAVLMYGFIANKSMLRLSLLNLKGKIAREIISKGLPKATRRLCNVFRPVLINHLVITIGGTLAMSAFSIQHSVAEFLELLGTCCGDVVVLMCGVFYGEENEDELSDTLRIAFRYVIFGVSAVTLISFFGAKGIASFYLGNQVKAVDMATLCLQLYALKLPFLAFNEIYMNYFQALGDNKRSHLLSVLHRLVFIVASAFILGYFFGIAGVWAAFPVSEILLSLTVVIMAMIHEKKFPRSLKDMLFLPSGFGIAPEYRFRKEIITKEDALEVSKLAYEFCRKINLSEKRSLYVSLCVEELGMNTASYAILDKANQSAEVIISLVRNDLIIRFRDNGKAFDLTKWVKLFHDNDDPSAHIGIKLLTGLAKEVTYTNSLNTNNVIIKL